MSGRWPVVRAIIGPAADVTNIHGIWRSIRSGPDLQPHPLPANRADPFDHLRPARTSRRTA